MTRFISRFLAAISAFSIIAAIPDMPAQAQSTPVTISIDASSGRHDISPLIYGVAFGSDKDVKALHATANRIGGNNFTRYNWTNNTVNIDNDWYFESIPGSYYPSPPKSMVPGARVDLFVKESKDGGAEPLITIPMLGWVAKVTDPSKTLSSFSVAKYGAQQKTDSGNLDAGNGIKLDGTKITGNDPKDADVPSDVAFQRGFVQHEIAKWGKSDNGGVKFYIMDNEPGLWSSTHRDVHPQPMTQDEYLKDFLGYASMVKSLDPKAMVVAPEEWGWPAFFEDGAGNDYRAAHGYPNDTPSRAARGGLDFLPWLLQQIHLHDLKTGKRTLDYFTVHLYPQGGDGGDDVTPKTELLRNRDTRAFWDPTYVDEDWINNTIDLLPRLKKWVAQYYPGTKIGVTEYNWGAENSINGATAQADIMGIFGREGIDLATRWTTPAADSPTFKAMQMYRNYDGKDSAFGSIGVQDKASSNPSDLSSFASVRRSDGALTVMVINKQLSTDQTVKINIDGFGKRLNHRAIAYQLTSANKITELDPQYALLNGSTISVVLPAQSITLLFWGGIRKVRLAMPEEETIISRYDSYVNDLLARDDETLVSVRKNMADSGLPSIAVSSSEGAMLRGLVQISGARRILEVGTLGGYSAIQMARAMQPGGKIVTLELSELHASVARKNIELAGFSDVIDVKIGPGADTLAAMNADKTLASFDLAFIDADKPGYPVYLDLALPMIKIGGLILSDNTLPESVLETPDTGMGAYNTKAVTHPQLTSFMLPVLRGDHVDGLLVSIKTG